MIDVFYGVNSSYLNVTDTVLDHCVHRGRLFIPAREDLRNLVFSDPEPEMVKSVVLIREMDGAKTCQIFGPEDDLDIDLTPDEIRPGNSSSRISLPAGISVDEAVKHIHSQLYFLLGRLADEWKMQALSVAWLDPDAKVLQLGSNIGRNTLMISSLLNDDRNLVALDCAPLSIEWLRLNRFINRRHFHIEHAALSYRRLIQRGFGTVPSTELYPGYDPVHTTTYEELLQTYSIQFDTLVSDCEGAIYYILQDNPGILDTMSTIFAKSTYRSVEHKLWTDALFLEKGFSRVHSEPLVGAEWLPAPDACQASFYEVWKR
jgi:hypothetical protein